LIRKCCWWKKDQPARKPFLTFDGSAQYLTSPSTPYLIAQAYYEANLPPPILVACVRDPIDQTLSWWEYENNAMSWGAGMGLKEWNTELRSVKYPPISVEEALDFSLSKFVKDSYKNAEKIFAIEAKDMRRKKVSLPSGAMTWPAGQLSGIGRNGLFASNIQRYESVFRTIFVETNASQKIAKSKLQFVNVLPLEYLASNDLLKNFLTSILKKNAERKVGLERSYFRNAVKNFQCSSVSLSNIHRNSIVRKRNGRAMLSDETYARLREHFREDSSQLEEMFGRIPWECKSN